MTPISASWGLCETEATSFLSLSLSYFYFSIIFFQAFKEKEKKKLKRTLWTQVYHWVPHAAHCHKILLRIVWKFPLDPLTILMPISFGSADAHMFQIQRGSKKNVPVRGITTSPLHMYLSLHSFYFKELTLFTQQTVSIGPEFTKHSTLKGRVKNICL